MAASGLLDRVGQATATIGTGTLTLGAALGAVSPFTAAFHTFAAAGAVNATAYRYLILDANGAWELGSGTYTSSGTTLSRSPIFSSNSNALVPLSGNAQVFVTLAAEDVVTLAGTNTWTGANTFSNSVTTPTLNGGAAAGSTLSLVSTSNGSPSGDSITMTQAGALVLTVGTFGGANGVLQSNQNVTSTALSASGLTNPGVQVAIADTVGGGFGVATYGAIATIQALRWNGTAASPSALTTGAEIARMAVNGALTTSTTKGAGRISAFAAENWSATAYGLYFSILTTAAGGGSPSIGERVRFQASGGVSIGALTTDPGAGGLIVGGTTTATSTTTGALVVSGGVGIAGAIFGGSTLSVATGYQINGGAASGNVLRGNGTNFVSAQLGLTDLSGISNLLASNATATMTVGLTFTPYSGGTISSGTFTPAAANGNYQYYTNNGAHTFAAPAADSAMDILVTNGASAGAITFSGFTVGANVGDALDTTNTHKFIVSVRRINSVSTYVVKALQ